MKVAESRDSMMTPQALCAAGMATGADMRVAAFTGGRTISSARFRIRQYIPFLRKHGVLLTEYIARFGSWPPAVKVKRPFWLAATLADRVPAVAKSHRYDLTLLQREMVSTLVTLERFTGRPRLLDVDDAVWLNRDFEANFGRLVQMCDGVICGNSFIADAVQRWHHDILVLPTAVDTDRCCPIDNSSKSGSKQIIGWSGLGAGFKYLLGIEGALTKVLESNKSAVLRVVSDVRPRFRTLHSSRVEYIPWSPENEVRTIQEMSIGLMPVEDSVWARGKCSYKMLLYMACGVPAVVSPVGMNSEVLALDRVGLGPRSESEWVDCVTWLLHDAETRTRMGALGRRVIEEHYSLRTLAPHFAAYVRRFSRRNR